MATKRVSRSGRARSQARRLAIQALYQWQLTQQDAEEIQGQFVESEEFPGADAEYFAELLGSCIGRSTELDKMLAAHADRPVEQLDPVEHAILLVGMYELVERLDVPYRVVINEAVELSKRFGATDGHKYINALLDRAAGERRAAEKR